MDKMAICQGDNMTKRQYAYLMAFLIVLALSVAGFADLSMDWTMEIAADG